MGQGYKRVTDDEIPSNPKQGASLFSLVTFRWFTDLLVAGQDRPLSSEDMFPLLAEDQSKELTRSLERKWNSRKPIPDSWPKWNGQRLVRTLVCIIPTSEYCLIVALMVLDATARLCQPLFLIGLLAQLMNKSSPVSLNPWVYVYAGLISFGALIMAVSKCHLDYRSSLVGMRVRAALLGLLYRKVLHLSLSDQAAMTSGHVINIISNDIQRFNDAIRFLPSICVAPFALLAVCAVSVYLIGWQALIGFVLFTSLIIYQSKVARMVSILRKKAAELADRRLRMLNEIIMGIRAVKMYAWEKHFRKTISSVRGEEIRTIRVISGFLASLFALNMTRSLVPLAVFLTLLLTGSTLTPYNIFLVFSYSIAIGEYVLFYLAQGSKTVIECCMTAARIQEFLETIDTTLELRNGICRRQLEFTESANPECKAQEHSIQQEKLSSNEISAQSKDYELYKKQRVSPLVTLRFGSTEKAILHSIDFCFQEHKLIIIKGPVGCGKSSLLLTILGELPTDQAQLVRHGTVAFVPEIPWVFSGSLRDNIVFNSPYDPQKFAKVVDVCAMAKDIAMFPNGDLTLLGERGVLLSGGQRARVGLARAVYADADLYLLDDPLSAVDAEVAHHIFKKCICQHLGGRGRILVTHQPVYLKYADRIVSMQNGSIEWEGSYSALLLRKNMANAEEAGEVTASSDKAQKPPSGEEASNHERPRETEECLTVLEEERQFGSVTYKTYWNYMKAGCSVICLVPLLGFLVFCQVFRAVPDWWMAGWDHVTWSSVEHRHSFYIYITLVMALLLLSYVSSLMFYQVAINATKHLHSAMLWSVLTAPLLFFDTNPAGRVLNRFSKDLGFMDETLLEKLLESLQQFFLLCMFILVPAVANFWNLVAVTPLVIAAMYYGRYCIRASREVARLEAIERSHVYSHFSLTLQGLSTIRSYKRQEDFIREFYRKQDELTKTWFVSLTIVRWLSFRLDTMVTVFVTAVTFTALLTSEDAGFTGLAVVYSVRLLEMLDLMVRYVIEVENMMTSVERVMTYTKLDSEPGYANQSEPPENWPSQIGVINFENLSMVYYPGGPTVLENLSFTVEPKEKLGIAGRTGAGKSSVVAALLRMPEPTGLISIDGSDVRQFNLPSYRSKISVIAQDPVLFSGTLRANLDPTASFKDTDVWNALEAVHMKTPVTELEKKLNFELTEGGLNFSAGQRQLLCLARALLQGNKIIVLDEATANVDVATDDLIQETIRTKFQECTVLTIAHRVSTILDYDRVMVLDGGRIIECDKPEILLSMEGGKFAELCRYHHVTK